MWRVAFLAGVLLFAQFAVASQACMVAQQHAGMPRDDACLAQCIAEDQAVSSLEHHFSAMPAVAASASLDFPLVATQASARLLSDAPLPAGPPLEVLFCSYQN